MNRTRSATPDPDSGPDSHGSRPESRETVEAVFRAESRRVLATLIRILGDFEVAEDALQEAFAAAVEQWPEKGVPANPRAWLVSTGRHRAIDALRRKSRYDEKLEQLTRELDGERSLHDPPTGEGWDGQDAADDQLRLIFTCCHPALAPEAQVALTLREICGLTTEEIARAFLTSPPTLAQRIVRAKRKIRDAGIPYEVPERSEMPERLEGVLRVIYLVFNEGYSASFGDSLTRADLSNEAPAGAPPGGAPPRTRGHGAPGPHAPPRVQEASPEHLRRRPCATGGPGPLPVGSGSHRRSA